VLTLLLLRLTAGPAVAPAGAVPSTPQTVVDNCRTTPPGHDC
jgi:hypothetical protein